MTLDKAKKSRMNEEKVAGNGVMESGSSDFEALRTDDNERTKLKAHRTHDREIT